MDKSVLAKDLQLAPSELYVNNLAKMTDFYSNIVGLDVLEKLPKYAILGYDKTPIIRLTEKPNLKPASFPSAGLFHNAILYKSRAKLAQTVNNIMTKASQFYSGTGDHIVSEAFYFNDPENNGLELYYDRPRSQWQWNNGRITMDTLYIDPEKYIDQYITTDEVSDEKRLGHVHLRVGDITSARKFYVDVLGFDITFDMPSALFLSVGGYHHHIGANTWMSQGAGVRTPALGLAEFDIYLPDDKDMANLDDRLQKHEIKFVGKNGQIDVVDPWGNKIVFKYT